MTPRYYHTPPPPVSTRVRCPVCHEAVYSRAGIHPQCAVRQSDPPKPRNKPKAVPVAIEQVAQTVGQVAVKAVVDPADTARTAAVGRRFVSFGSRSA
jgi:hypothetical protein